MTRRSRVNRTGLVGGACLVLLAAVLSADVALDASRVVAESGVRGGAVTLGIDRSGSMTCLGGDGHARVRKYLKTMLFGGFSASDLEAPDHLVWPVDEGGAALGELFADGLLSAGESADVFWFGSSISDVGGIADAADLERFYPSPRVMRGTSKLGDAAERGVRSLSGVSAVYDVYFVEVSDRIEDAGGYGAADREQELKKLRIDAEYPNRVVATLEVYVRSDCRAFVRVGEYVSLPGLERAVADVEAQVEARAAGSSVVADESVAPGITETLLTTIETIEGILREIPLPQEEREGLERKLWAAREGLERTPRQVVVGRGFRALQPAAGARLRSGDVHVAWTEANRALTYTLTISDAEGVGVVVSTIVSQTETVVSLDPGDYVYSVSAVDAGGGRTYSVDGDIPFTVVKPRSFGRMVGMLLVAIGGIAVGARVIVLRGRPLQVTVKGVVPDKRAKTFELAAGSRFSRIYLHERTDGELFYDVGVPQGFLKRGSRGQLFLYGDESGTGRRIKWGESVEIRRSARDVGVQVMVVKGGVDRLQE